MISAALLFILLLSLTRLDTVPALVPAALVGVMALAAWRPSAGLLLVTGVIPVATWIGRTWTPAIAWPETIVVAFLAGYCARLALRREQTADRLNLPLIILTALVIASLAVELMVLQWRVGGDVLRGRLLDAFRTDYFLRGATSDALDAGMRLLEGLLLLRCGASIAQRNPSFVPRLAGWFVAGAASAGALNLWRLWQGAQRSDAPLPTFIEYLGNIRFNVHYGDLNAAGSYFVLALFVAAGLTLRSRRPHWMIAAIPIAAALWVSGSRAAMGAGWLAGLLLVAGSIRLSRAPTVRVLAATGMLAILVTAGVAYHVPQRGSQPPSSTALQVRWELTRTSVRMLSVHPAFGVGLGEYYRRSGEFSSPVLLHIFPAAHSENAHNNFLQILAELGVTGFAAFVWLLAVAAGACIRMVRTDPRDRLRWGLAAGLLAFVLTWLAGHPLLIDEPAFSFWILLGAAAGWGLTSSAQRTPSRATTWAIAVIIAAIAATIPLRARFQRADAELEHRGIGVSLWQEAIDGVRYRLAGRASTVFLPAGATAVTIPLRAVGTGEPLVVELRLDGRPADVVFVPSDRWFLLRLALPASGGATRSHRLDLQISDTASTDALLMIGKVEPH